MTDFFKEHGDKKLNPSAPNEHPHSKGMYKGTVEELYQAFKERLTAEVSISKSAIELANYD